MGAQVAAQRRIGAGPWSSIQWAVFVIAVVHIAWAIAGWIAEPSFAMGAHAPATPVLGMDYNGWHAVAGLLLFVPGLVAMRRKSWSAWYCLAAGVGGGFIIGIWALFARNILVFSFPNHRLDAVEHIVTGLVLIGVVALQAVRDGGLRPVLFERR